MRVDGGKGRRTGATGARPQGLERQGPRPAERTGAWRQGIGISTATGRAPPCGRERSAARRSGVEARGSAGRAGKANAPGVDVLQVEELLPLPPRRAMAKAPACAANDHGASGASSPSQEQMGGR